MYLYLLFTINKDFNKLFLNEWFLIFLVVINAFFFKMTLIITRFLLLYKIPRRKCRENVTGWLATPAGLSAI